LKTPLLLDGFKFDIRIYVLITSCQPLRLYVFDEGIVRLATEKFIEAFYSPYNLLDLHMHLTNYAINKQSDKF